ncbi:MFS transporter [Cohnella sp. AR92]|uniref:MFS transporter n=1 Tax=Cohnella sp. AR92 TaxID=648716 RepID=UPI000F8DEA08|nr:MFS transporter [Cohnella sp. AR92]RUS48541.1 MFS transporter [Cohnella sp. AR92]
MKNIAIYWIAAGAFLVGTSELVIAGLLDTLAADLNVSLAAAGQLVAVYSFAFAIGSPVLTALTARVNRTKLLAGSLVTFAAGCLVAFVSHDYALLLLSRIVLALSAGIYTVVSLHVGTSLVPPEKKGRAVGTILLGTSGSMVLGVPLGVAVGHAFGWRANFALLAALALVVALAVRMTAKAASEATPSVGSADELPRGQRLARALNGRAVSALGSSLLWITGYSTVYTYISPFLQTRSQVPGGQIGSVLLLFGVCGVAADRWGTSKTLTWTIALHAAALLLLSVAGQRPWSALIAGAWACSAWMTLPVLQVRFASLDSRSSGFLISLNSSVIHLGIALGAALGGIVIEAAPLNALGGIGAAVVAAALPLVALSFRASSAVRAEGTNVN